MSRLINMLNVPGLPAKCHCGRKMHLSYAQKFLLSSRYEAWGDYKRVVFQGVVYKVPVYYIILHGLKAIDLPKLGFDIESQT